DPIVYSTDKGRIQQSNTSTQTTGPSDGIVRIWRQTSGRKGKGVSVITGLPLTVTDLHTLAAELKKRCGCGGAVKDFTIEIQGDKRQLLKTLLEQKGFTVKLAGG